MAAVDVDSEMSGWLGRGSAARLLASELLTQGSWTPQMQAASSPEHGPMSVQQTVLRDGNRGTESFEDEAQGVRDRIRPEQAHGECHGQPTRQPSRVAREVAPRGAVPGSTGSGVWSCVSLGSGVGHMGVGVRGPASARTSG